VLAERRLPAITWVGDIRCEGPSHNEMPAERLFGICELNLAQTTDGNGQHD
jgi:hypothetical protein